MSTFKGFAAMVAGLALVAAPVAAAAAPAANPAAKLSVARAGAKTTNGSKLGAGVGGSTLINIGILAALVAVVLVATKGGDNSASK